MLKDYISSASLFVSTIVLFFGNNFIGQFKKAELIYFEKRTEIALPPGLAIIQKPMIKSFTPDLYRELLIKNVGGKPSSKLKIIIQLDGKEFSSQLSCIENINNINHYENKIDIVLDRLTNNAEIDIKLWLKHDQNRFSIISIDDEGMKEIKPFQADNSPNYLRILSIFPLLILIILVTYRFYIKPLNLNSRQIQEKNAELQQSNDELRAQNESLSSEIEDLQSKIEDKNSNSHKNILSELQVFIDTHGK